MIVIKPRGKKIILIFLILTVLLSSASCAGEKSSGDETTAPLDLMIAGFLEKNAGKYKSAFLPDYIDVLERELQQIDESLDAEIQTAVAANTGALEFNYGVKNKIVYVLKEKRGLSSDEIYEKYTDIYMDDYILPDGIERAYETSVSLKVSGKDRSSEKELTFIFLFADGKWYMHPKAFMYMFSS